MPTSATTANYAIEPIPARFCTEKTSCALAVCLAKNNPLLNETEHGVQTLHKLLKDLCEKHTIVYILVADAINVYERMISNGTTTNQAIRMANAEGERIANLYRAYAKELSLDNMKIIRWKEIEDAEYARRVEIYTKLATEKETLATFLSDTAAFYIKRRNPSVTINAARIKYFEQYLLNEMVVQLHGLEKQGAITEQCKIVYHAVYVNALEDASSYESPVLDLKKAFKQVYTGCDAFTSRIFIEKPK
jgi:hypothetical protein